MMPYNHLIPAVPFSSCPQSFQASESFPINWLFASSGQSIAASSLVSVLPVNIQGWFPFRLTGLISLLSKGFSRVFSSTTVQKHQFFGTQLSLWSNFHIIHDYWKNHSFDYADICWQNDTSAFKYAVQVWNSFSSKEQASFNFMAVVTICIDFWAKENEIWHCFHFSPIYSQWSDGTGCHDLHCFESNMGIQIVDMIKVLK